MIAKGKSFIYGGFGMLGNHHFKAKKFVHLLRRSRQNAKKPRQQRDCRILLIRQSAYV